MSALVENDCYSFCCNSRIVYFLWKICGIERANSWILAIGAIELDSPGMSVVSDMISETSLRQALGQYATGIAVATTLDGEGEPHGLTINSFNSVSLDPPLVLWSLAKGSHQLEAFETSGCYAINILSETQQEVSVRFAAPVADRFDGCDWDTGSAGAPILSGVVASIQCKTEKILDGGDHIILLGRVVEVSHSSLPPLLYHGGAYHSLGDALQAVQA